MVAPPHLFSPGNLSASHGLWSQELSQAEVISLYRKLFLLLCSWFAWFKCIVSHLSGLIFAHFASVFARMIRTKGRMQKFDISKVGSVKNLSSLRIFALCTTYCSLKLCLLIWPGLFNLSTGTAILMRRIWNISPIYGSCTSNYTPFHQNIFEYCHCKSWFIVKWFPCYCCCFPPTF